MPAVPGGPVYEVPAWWWLPGWLKPKPAPAPVHPPLPVIPNPVPVPNDSISAEVVTALNVERSKNGLPPLKVDSSLTLTATYWAADMARLHQMFHGDFPARISTVHPGTAAGEVIAEDYPDVHSVVAGWMGSPEHKAIILGNYNMAGAGKCVSKDGHLYWCCDFDLFN